MKYKIGDEIRLTTDESKLNAIGITNKFVGKEATITYVGINIYKARIDDCDGWILEESQIEGLNKINWKKVLKK